MTLKTPLDCLPRLSQSLGIDLRAKRDDLFPVMGGGNKGRKITYIMEEAEKLGSSALVTTGGTQSNHARVTALAAASRGWQCKLVLHGKPDALVRPKGNLLLMKLAGAEIEVVEPSCIAPAMRSALESLRSEGFRPYEIPGGGHTLAGAMAYVDAVEELHSQCQDGHWRPDYIILASGTGTTQAGLTVGLEQLGWRTRVIGISIARQNPRGMNIVKKACKDLRGHLGMPESFIDVDFRDEWVGGGYEEAGERALGTVSMIAKTTGLILDPTYTGKAFTALIDLICKGEIEKGSKVLFWHTGGLLNLMASEYFNEGGGNS